MSSFKARIVASSILSNLELFDPFPSLKKGHKLQRINREKNAMESSEKTKDEMNGTVPLPNFPGDFRREAPPLLTRVSMRKRIIQIPKEGCQLLKH